MQFNISLRCLDESPVLPINYQYEISAWIYKTIQNADADYAGFLHQKGYKTPALKTFKLFCFSQLQVPKRRVVGDRLYIDCREVSLRVGFYVDKAAEEFIRGLFQEQEMRIGDRISQVRFVVQSVDLLPTIVRTGAPVRLRTLSPLVVAKKHTDGSQDTYLSPDDPEFGPLLFLNILEKYRAATGGSVPVWWNANRFGYRLVGALPKSQLITIKTGTDAQTKIRGWRFSFELDVPPELLELGFGAGWGRMNGEGFGFVGLDG